VRTVVRHSAKIALLCFAAAFSASSLHSLFPSRTSRYLLGNRRMLGLSFALSHGLHLAALVALGLWFPDPFVGTLDAVTLVGGGIAYLFVLLMAATSWDGAVRALGPKRWRLLHTIGGWYIWTVFTQSYLPRALADVSYAPFAALLLAAAGLRIARWRVVRRREAVARAGAFSS
jgi:DMSO/TMAO reductase YedYZ heme-binding membrane subunit